MSERIDLQQFCLKEEAQARPYIANPFRIGDFTYATNGHVLIRVPAIDSDHVVSEGFLIPLATLEKILNAQPDAVFSPLRVKLPVSDNVPCDTCGGDGIWKDDPAPGLYTTCEACDGSGKMKVQCSVSIAGSLFMARYIEQISALPQAEFTTNPIPMTGPFTEVPCPFRFLGGKGSIMPMRGEGRDGHLGDIDQFRVTP